MVYVAYHILDSVPAPFLLVVLVIATVLPLLFGMVGLSSLEQEPESRREPCFVTP